MIDDDGMTQDDLVIPAPDELRLLYRPPLIGSSAQMTMIVQRLEAMIFAGELAPGQRLIEADLSARFGVVRGRVREALLILSGDGIVELVPQRGARVVKLDPGGIAHALEALQAIASKGMELFGRRFGKPVGRVAEAVLAAFQRIEATADGPGATMSRHWLEYHVLLNHLSGNPKLNTLVSKIGIIPYQRQLGEFIAEESRRYVVEPHREITDFLLAGRTAEAIASLRLHVAVLVDRLEQAD
jgi:DNA-binding GntR family transcriptional regulator